MDKIFSARVDEAVVERISGLARQLRISKKSVIEQAISVFADKVDSEGQTDILKLTCGAWQRPETTRETVRCAHETFRQSMDRHRR